MIGKKRKANHIKEAKRVDPVVFNDPLALKVSWDQVNSNVFTGASHYLRRDIYGTLELAYSKMFFLTFGFFFIFGLVFAGIGIYFFVQGIVTKNIDYSDKSVIGIIGRCFEFFGTYIGPLIFLIFGLIFIVILFAVMKTCFAKIVFSPDINAYYKDTRHYSKLSDCTLLNDYTPFRDIAALQIIEKVILASDCYYINYELNLVLRNAERLNVITNSSYKNVVSAGIEIAEFLHIPLWDAVSEHDNT